MALVGSSLICHAGSSTSPHRENVGDVWPGLCSVHRLQYNAFDSISQFKMFDILSEMGFPKASRRPTGSALQ